MFAALLPAVGRDRHPRVEPRARPIPKRWRAGARDRAGAADRRSRPSPIDALDAAWRASPRIVVAGSIFLLGDVMKELGGS